MIVLKKKYPLVLQYDQVDCGPAALLSVLRFYGGESSLVQIREISNTTAYGSTMYDLVNAAKRLGFSARGATGEYESLEKEKMPCIAHVITGMIQHFVVVYKINKKGVLVGDPARGVYSLSRSAFCEIWKTKAVILLTPQARLHHQSAPDWKDWIHEYLIKEINWVYQILFLGFVYTIIGLLTSVFLQTIVDQHVPNGSYGKILATGIFLSAILLIRAGTGFLREYFLLVLNKKVNVSINSDFLQHLYHLPKNFFDTRKTGDITSRIGDALKIQQAILYFVGTAAMDGLIAIGSLLFLFFFSSLIGWAACVIFPVYFFCLSFSVKKLRTQQYAVLSGYAAVESAYIDSITGIDEILATASNSTFVSHNRMLFRAFQERQQQLGLLQAKLNLSADIFGSVIIIGSLLASALGVMNGMMRLGEMMASYALLTGMIPSINHLVYGNMLLQEASVASTRLMDICLIEKETSRGDRPFHMEKEIALVNATFSRNNARPLLSGINMSVACGRITGLWGASGSGKSTLVDLLQRKYSLAKGNIFIDGVDSTAFDLNSYRRKIAIVPQQIKIFNGTLLQNILMGMEAPPLQDVVRKIREFDFSFFLDRFAEQGLLTMIGEDGRRLSGGEVQMLGMVRALYRNPEILIVDEGFAGLDIGIEERIFDVIKIFSRNHAVLLITHNKELLLQTDYLYIIDKCTISDEGCPIDVFSRLDVFAPSIGCR